MRLKVFLLFFFQLSAVITKAGNGGTLMQSGSACGLSKSSCDMVSLAGSWQVSLDSLRTFHPIALPGTLDMAGLGSPDDTNITSVSQGSKKWGEVMRHLTRKHSFTGAAFYKRNIDIPKSMAGRPLTITLERVIWASQVWVDGASAVAGHCGCQREESLATPHVYTIPGGLKAGRHELLIRIDNRKQHDISYEEMAHAYTDETQTKWNGILGQMTLKAENQVRILSVEAYSDIASKSVKVRAALVGTKRCRGVVGFSVGNIEGSRSVNDEYKKLVTCDVGRDTAVVEAVVSLGDSVALWDEFSPNLYSLSVTFSKGKKAPVGNGEILDNKVTTFGMREISVVDGHLAVNGRRIFLRGALECCVFPLAGCPPTDEEGWEKVFASAKAWGLNHLRFHSYCPPDAAFRVADRMGFYVQVELPVWSLNIGKDPAVSSFLRQEYDRIVESYGNHPSFCLLSCGNELQPDFEFLNAFVKYMKARDPRHLYTTSTFTFEKGHGRHPEPEDQYFVTQWTDKGWVRGQGVFDTEQPNFNKDYREATEGITVPLVSHEIGQYSVYPNMREIDKYTGILAPLNFMYIREDLRRKGLLGKAGDYLKASGRLAVQLYKEEIERAMKTPKFDGFQLLGLQDFPGQSTALVGLLDAFWDSKGLATPEYFRQFCAPVVPLARFGKATWSSGETFKAQIEVANYGKENLEGKTLSWSLADEAGQCIAGSSSNAMTQGLDGRPCIDVETPLDMVKIASRLTLTASIDGTPYHNSWHIWVYPETKDSLETLLCNNKARIVLTQDIDEAVEALEKGKTVLCSPKKESLKGLEGKFLPVFWSPVHFKNQAGTMGLHVDPKHPALAHFPTEMNSDWQWWSLVKRSRVVVMDSINGAAPIIENVDNFASNRRLASAFEAQCGKGRLLFCSMDILSPDEGKPEVRQLLYSLLAYISSPAFAPKGAITKEQLMSVSAMYNKLGGNRDAVKESTPSSIYD